MVPYMVPRAQVLGAEMYLPLLDIRAVYGFWRVWGGFKASVWKAVWGGFGVITFSWRGSRFCCL